MSGTSDTKVTPMRAFYSFSSSAFTLEPNQLDFSLIETSASGVVTMALPSASSILAYTSSLLLRRVIENESFEFDIRNTSTISGHASLTLPSDDSISLATNSSLITSAGYVTHYVLRISADGLSAQAVLTSYPYGPTAGAPIGGGTSTPQSAVYVDALYLQASGVAPIGCNNYVKLVTAATSGGHAYTATLPNQSTSGSVLLHNSTATVSTKSFDTSNTVESPLNLLSSLLSHGNSLITSQAGSSETDSFRLPYIGDVGSSIVILNPSTPAPLYVSAVSSPVGAFPFPNQTIQSTSATAARYSNLDAGKWNPSPFLASGSPGGSWIQTSTSGFFNRVQSAGDGGDVIICYCTLLGTFSNLNQTGIIDGWTFSIDVTLPFAVTSASTGLPVSLTATTVGGPAFCSGLMTYDPTYQTYGTTNMVVIGGTVTPAVNDRQDSQVYLTISCNSASVTAACTSTVSISATFAYSGDGS